MNEADARIKAVMGRCEAMLDAINAVLKETLNENRPNPLDNMSQIHAWRLTLQEISQALRGLMAQDRRWEARTLLRRLLQACKQMDATLSDCQCAIVRWNSQRN